MTKVCSCDDLRGATRLQITASMQLREQMGEAQEALTQRARLQAMVREAHDALSALQARPRRCQGLVGFHLLASVCVWLGNGNMLI